MKSMNYILVNSKYARWIRKYENVLKLGGYVMDITFMDNGIHVLLFNKYTNKKYHI